MGGTQYQISSSESDIQPEFFTEFLFSPAEFDSPTMHQFLQTPVPSLNPMTPLLQQSQNNSYDVCFITCIHFTKSIFRI